MKVEPPIPRAAIAQLARGLGRSMKGWDRSPPRHVSPIPKVKGAYFDVDAVLHVLDAIRQLPHTQGRWNGTPFDASPWEIVWILAPVFGWKHPDGTRIVREAWIEIPRRNGKSSISWRVAIVLLAADGESGAEVYSAAATEKQAGRLLRAAGNVVRRAPALRGRVVALKSEIRVPRTNSFFMVLSSAGGAAQGLDVHGAVIDEVHVHKSRDLIDAIETGTGSRLQPLIFYITTADEGDDTTIYGEKHADALALTSDEPARPVDPSTYVVIWCADRDDDPFAEATLIKANPGYPISPTKDYLDRKIRKAMRSPTWLPTYLRMHLNIRQTAAAAPWPGAEFWPIGLADPPLFAHELDDRLRGERVWGGLVCSSASDLSAIAWIGRDPDVARWFTVWRFFLPEASLPSLAARTGRKANDWVKDGGPVQLTEGEVLDEGALIEQIRADCLRFNAQQLAYDPNGSIGVVSALMRDDVVQVVPIYSNTQGSALIDWERLLRSGEYLHGQNPVMAWQVANVRVRDSAGQVTRIDRKGSRDRVDGAVAAEFALRRALLDVQHEPAKLVFM